MKTWFTRQLTNEEQQSRRAMGVVILGFSLVFAAFALLYRHKLHASSAVFITMNLMTATALLVPYEFFRKWWWCFIAAYGVICVYGIVSILNAG